MSNHRYLIPKEYYQTEIDVKHSRFICHLAHTSEIEIAKSFIATIKQQYSDATHNCWAYQAGPVADSRKIGCSDDGEPHGTAGRPMLNVLMYAAVGEITAVVTRYYGGTKLGTGGLARAYSEVVKLALESVQTTEKIDFSFFSLQLDYGYWPQVEQLLNQYQAQEIKPEFSDFIKVVFRLDEQCLEPFNQQLADITHGQSSSKKLLCPKRGLSVNEQLAK